MSISTDRPEKIDADAVVIGLTPGDDGPRIAGATTAATGLDQRLLSALSAVGATGKAGEVTKIPALGALGSPLLVAAGLGSDPGLETLRRAAGAAARELEGKGHAVLSLPDGSADEAEAVTLGALLGAYNFGRYQKDRRKPVDRLTLVTRHGDGVTERAQAVAQAVHLNRDLVNTPPRDLPPAAFAELAERHAADFGLEVEVLDEKALREGGYGGLTGVGQGSENPPRLVRLSYAPPGAAKTLALAGKGITFDTGGLSLKPNDGMVDMKSDMSGAAAVLGAILAISRLGLDVNVIAYLALAENMPSGNAQRPSDVITIYGGTTVEVLNTDAEGRLVLADALGRATEDEPDLIVDVATLTGAQVVALGRRTAGVMANDESARDEVLAAAEAAGETMWGMPLPEELRRSLESSTADIANVTGDRYGGMLAAGVFLKEFVPEGHRWAHIDIAGPSFHKGEPYGYTVKGGTGIGVRTLVRLAQEYSG